MLVLSRKTKQSIRFVIPEDYVIPKGGLEFEVTLLQVKGKTARIGSDAPKDIRVVRAELDEFTDEPIDTSGVDVNAAILKAAQSLHRDGINVMGQEGTPDDEPAAV